MDQDYEKFLKLLPNILELAGEITTAETQQAILAIIDDSVPGSQKRDYVSSFSVQQISPEKRIIDFSPKTDVIKFLETGVQSFSMKEKMLQPGKQGVKMSKEGFLYKRVTINKDSIATDDSAGDIQDREAEIRENIQNVLASAKLSFKFAFTDKKTGEYGRVENVDSGGLLKISTFESRGAFDRGTKPKKVGALLFRTMSLRPGTSEWKHPGFKGREVYRKIEEWQIENEDRIFNETCDKLLELFFK